MKERILKIQKLALDLRSQADLVAARGSPSDQYEFVEVSTEVIAKVLYVYNLDDDFLGEMNKLLDDRVNDLKPNVEAIHDAFYYTKRYLIPRLLESVNSWLC